MADCLCNSRSEMPCVYCAGAARLRQCKPAVSGPIKGPASISALSTSDRAIENQNRAALAGQAAGFPYK